MAQPIQPTSNLKIRELRPVISPAVLMEELPITQEIAEVVLKTRREAEDIIKGKDDRLLVIVGPCSIHDPAAAIEYAKKLKVIADQLQDDLHIIMRVYFEKPRTNIGWKGLINDPDLDNSFNINKGLRVARKLLLDINALGLPTGTEFLDTIIPQFIGDLIAWGAIGARTTESQVHRELTSGLSAPIGFKNGTTGNVQIAVDAIKAASNSHHFLSITPHGSSAIVSTSGNDACHVILRGSSSGPNYDAQSVADAVAALEKAKQNSKIMIDCSHGNSQKDHTRQPIVTEEVCKQIENGSESIFGLMLESNLVEGKQSEPKTYGQSITDACLSWEQTIPVLERLAKAAATRRHINN